MPENKSKKEEKYTDIKTLLKNRQEPKKQPAYEWQDLALRVINELDVPGFKRASVFQACKKHGKTFIEMSLNDTKELCKSGEKWKYFFKIITAKK